MKKIIIALLTGMILICFSSCMPNEEAENMTDALKISVWVMDKSLEGTGYWEYDTKTIRNGHWVSYESDKQLDADDVFKFEALELNEVRTTAPIGYMAMTNINITFDFDGLIEIEPEIPNDPRIQFAYNNDYSDKDIKNQIAFNTISFGKISMLAPTIVNICPQGEEMDDKPVITSDVKAGEEYYLDVRAYKIDGTLVVTAKLKLVTIEDKHFPYEAFKAHGHPRFAGSLAEGRTRFLSIELVSYEYSDIYIMS